MKNITFVISLITLCVLSVRAQTDNFEKFKQQQNERFNQFTDNQQAEWDAFRKKMNEQYAEFMRQKWEPVETHPEEKPIKEKEVKPAVYEEPAPSPTPIPQPKPEPAPKPIPVQPQVVVVPEPTPAPPPVAPVKPKEEIPFKRVSVSYYGSIVSIGFPTSDNLKISKLEENALADAWNVLSDSKFDITIKNALDVRDANNLCDWAYLDLLRRVTEKQYGTTNEAVLMQAYLMTQSGYRVRMGMTDKKLYLLVASQYNIYNMKFITEDGERYYIIGSKGNEQLHLCKSKFDKEQSLCLQMTKLPRLGEDLSDKRVLTSRKGLSAAVQVNKNLIDFFGNYPSACINGDFGTRWAAYANTPLDKSVMDMLYPVLKKSIAGMNERDAANLLLNWVQTAFVYGYDDQVWGGDRAFFAQETLHYPYSDCEDRAILFSRLVRDLLGLDVVLLYYPGHLATAVAFKGEVKGDWLTYRNRRYIVCDPTFENAPVGRTMPNMDNAKAKIIALK